MKYIDIIITENLRAKYYIPEDEKIKDIDEYYTESKPIFTRKCCTCDTWASYEKNKRCKKGAFMVQCNFCGNDFSIVVGMKGARKI